MKSQIRKLEVTSSPLARESVLTVHIPYSDGQKLAEKLKHINEGQYVIEIKKPRKSLNMNAYMWVLCREIGLKIGMHKEDVYKEAVRHTGKFIDMLIDTSDYDRATSTWEGNGKIGWFAETLHQTDTHTSVRFYIGSSVYDAEELRKLTQFVVDEAKDLGIETMTPSELDHLEYLWSAE